MHVALLWKNVAISFVNGKINFVTKVTWACTLRFYERMLQFHLSMGKWTRGCAYKNKALITLVSCEIWRDISRAEGEWNISPYLTLTRVIIIAWLGGQYIYIIAWLGGQYGEIFSSRVAVLARPQGGTIHNPRTDPYCPTQGTAIIYLLYDFERRCHGNKFCLSSFF